MENNSMGSTLRRLRDESNLSVKEVILELKKYDQDISDKTLYSYESGKRAASADMFLALCQIYKCNNILEIFSGIVPDCSIPDDSEWNIIEKYRTISAKNPTGKEVIEYIVEKELARCTSSKPEPPTFAEEHAQYNVVPFQQSLQPASAGRGTYLGPEAFETVMVQENSLTRRALFGVPVSGNSMEPTYHDGDILIIARADDMERGEIGIFTLDGEGYVKKLGNGELISLNQEYAPIQINESITPNGRVIGILDPQWIVK